MTKEVQMRSEYPKPKKEKKDKSDNNLLDSAIYWLVQVAFAVLSAAGVYGYLKPVDPILSIPMTTMLVGLMFYVSLRNR